MSYTDEAINTVISDLVSQTGPSNMIGLMLKQLLAERDEHQQDLIAERRACVDMWIQRDAALARVAQLEGALEQAHKDICSSSCIHGPPRPHCPACEDAREALSQSPSEALAAVRMAQRVLRDASIFLHWRTDDLCICFDKNRMGKPCRFHEVAPSVDAAEGALAKSFGEGEGAQ